MEFKGAIMLSGLREKRRKMIKEITRKVTYEVSVPLLSPIHFFATRLAYWTRGGACMCTCLYGIMLFARKETFN